MANLKNANKPKVSERDVLAKRLGVGPKEYQAMERGYEAVKDSGGRVFKGALASMTGTGSVISMAKDNIFEFPVFVSDTVPLEYATATNTLLEQVYASYLQMALTLDPVVTSEEIKKGAHFSKFKTNITKYIECVDLSFQKDACHALYQNDEMTMEFNLASIEDKDATYINEYMNYEPLSEFSHYFQEVSGSSGGSSGDDTLDDAEKRAKQYAAYIEQLAKAYKQLHEAEQSKHDEKARNEYMRRMKTERDAGKRCEDAAMRVTQLQVQLQSADAAHREALQQQLNAAQQELIQAQQNYDVVRARLDAEETDIMLTPEFKRLCDEVDKNQAQLRKLEQEILHGANKEAREQAKELRDAEKHAADMKTKAPQQIDETKINKLNTMKPLMMVVNLSVMDKEGGVSRPIEYMVGVKTHCRLVDSNTLPEVVQYPVREMDKVSRKAKWRAGELKFFKDIVFDIKGKKQTAIDSQDPKRKWYRRLYQLSHMKGDSVTARRITRKYGEGSAAGLIPNVTMVITQSDVNRIEDETGIDMMKPSNAMAFCQQLFMMGIVVIDIDSESIKLLFPDINNDYEVQSLAAVNKQIAQLDTAGTKTNDIFKMLR